MERHSGLNPALVISGSQSLAHCRTPGFILLQLRAVLDLASVSVQLKLCNPPRASTATAAVSALTAQARCKNNCNPTFRGFSVAGAGTKGVVPGCWCRRREHPCWVHLLAF